MQGDHCCNHLQISSGARDAQRTRDGECRWAFKASKLLHTMSGSLMGVFWVAAPVIYGWQQQLRSGVSCSSLSLPLAGEEVAT